MLPAKVSPVIGVLLVMIVALTPKGQNIDKSCMINQDSHNPFIRSGKLFHRSHRILPFKFPRVVTGRISEKNRGKWF
jgi:hypothetical protein